MTFRCFHYNIVPSLVKKENDFCFLFVYLHKSVDEIWAKNKIYLDIISFHDIIGIENPTRNVIQ